MTYTTPLTQNTTAAPINTIKMISLVLTVFDVPLLPPLEEVPLPLFPLLFPEDFFGVDFFGVAFVTLTVFVDFPGFVLSEVAVATFFTFFPARDASLKVTL